MHGIHPRFKIREGETLEIAKQAFNCLEANLKGRSKKVLGLGPRYLRPLTKTKYKNQDGGFMRKKKRATI